mgnify:CR=1 FL=1
MCFNFQSAIPESFDELRRSFKKKIDDVFDDLAAKYAELET